MAKKPEPKKPKKTTDKNRASRFIADPDEGNNLIPPKDGKKK